MTCPSSLPSIRCCDVRHQLRLVGGGDAAASKVLRQHLRECADCRTYRRSLSASLTALAAGRALPAAGGTFDAREASIWPAVDRTLRGGQPLRLAQDRSARWTRTKSFTVSVAAACLLLVAMALFGGGDPQAIADQPRSEKFAETASVLPVVTDATRLDRDDPSTARRTDSHSRSPGTLLGGDEPSPITPTSGSDVRPGRRHR